MIKIFFLFFILSTSVFAINDENEFNKQLILSKKNNPEALFKMGKFYYEGKIVKKSYEKAYKYLNKSSILEYTKANYSLGILYANKKTPYHNYKKAYEIFSELANKGHAAAQNKIGMFLSLGLGLPKDYKEAVKWYEKSSKQGYITAQCNLALMYAEGRGVFTNFGRAHAFAKDGKEKGNPICKKVWKEYNLHKYPNDDGFKFNFYVKP